jgi:hypothetical protein
MSSERQSTLLDQLENDNEKDDNPQSTFEPNDQVSEVLQSIVNETSMQQPLLNFQYPNNPIEYQPPVEVDKVNKKEDNIMLSIILSHDFKLAMLCSIIFLVLCFLPIETIVFKYIALDRIPFANVYIKAILAGILFFISARMLDNV